MAIEPNVISIDEPGVSCAWCGNDCVEWSWTFMRTSYWSIALFQHHCSIDCLNAHSAYHLGKNLRAVRRDGRAREELLRLLTLVLSKQGARPLVESLLALLSTPGQAPYHNKPGSYREQSVLAQES